MRRLYSNRGITDINDLEYSLKRLLPYEGLSNIDKAVYLIYKAFCKKKRIVVVGDFDVDGATSTALIILVIKALGYHNINYLIPNRFKYGYGLSTELVNEAYYDYGAQIIITVDNGTSSYNGVDLANKLGMKVLITDHHLSSKNLPNAAVIINPNLKEHDFPYKFLSGVGVVFYLMIALRAFLKKKCWFEENRINIPNLAEYLDLVALGTVVDMVPMNFNNRILVKQGLNRIRCGKCRPGIQALIKIANCNLQTLVANDFSFKIGPLLNSTGRLNDMSLGIKLLLCNNYHEAYLIVHKLDLLNCIRKEIESEMYLEALNLCNKMNYIKNNIPFGIVIQRHNWHQGIVGILASKIKEYFNIPVIVFASAVDGILNGSGRSIEGLNIYNLIKQIDEIYPNTLIKFGGHEMAVGLSLKESNLDKFKNCFNKLVMQYLNKLVLNNTVISDGQLNICEITIKTAQMILDSGPWGKKFPEPVFDGKFYVLNQKLIKNNHLKILLKSKYDSPILNGILFNANTNYWPDNRIYKVEIVYNLNINEFRHKRTLQIIINYIWPIKYR